MSFQAPNALTETPIIWCLGERLCSKSQEPIACVIHKLINSFIHHSFFIHSSFILHSSLSSFNYSSFIHLSSFKPFSSIHQSLLPSILLHPSITPPIHTPSSPPRIKHLDCLFDDVTPLLPGLFRVSRQPVSVVVW